MIKSECFNPYFYGTSTSTWPGRCICILRKVFQSLFLWNIYFNLLFLEDAYLREMFQSLFLWNIYFNCFSIRRIFCL